MNRILLTAVILFSTIATLFAQGTINTTDADSTNISDLDVYIQSQAHDSDSDRDTGLDSDMNSDTDSPDDNSDSSQELTDNIDYTTVPFGVSFVPGLTTWSHLGNKKIIHNFVFNFPIGSTYRIEGGAIGLALNITKELDGVMVCSGGNIVSGEMSGVIVSAGFNYANELNDGVLVTGGVNIIDKKGDGVLVGPVNLADTFDGAAIGTVNITGAMDGAAIGAVNVSGNFDGAMIGAVNIAGKLDGIPIGVVSVAGSSKFGGEVWYDEAGFANVALNVKNGKVYNIYGVGFDPNQSFYNATIGLGFAFGYKPVGFSIDFISSYYYENSLFFSGYCGTITRIRPAVGIKLFNFITINAGLSWDFVYDGLDSSLDIRPIHKYTIDSDGSEYWPGFYIGIKLQG